MAEFLKYEIWLGTYEGEEFVWKTIKKFDDRDKALAFFQSYTLKQMSYSEEELKRIWDSGRIDVELRQGKKLLNWAGMFSRAVSRDEDPDEEEDEESELEDAHPNMMREI